MPAMVHTLAKLANGLAGDYSLIVMGTQGRGFFGELFVGSVADHVARRTVVPTLLMPPLR